MGKKEFRVYKTDFDKYSIETVTHNYFYSISNLTDEQINTIINILSLNGYTDKTETD